MRLFFTILLSLWIAKLSAQAPDNLFIRELSSTEVELTWLDNSFTETGFEIVRSTDFAGAENISVFSVGADVTTFIDNTLSSGQGFYYRVQAIIGGTPTAPTNVKFGSTITLPGNALSFDGLNNQVIIADNTDLQFGNGDFTLEAWIYYDGADQAAAIIGKRNGVSPFEQIQLRIGTGLNQPAGKRVEAYVLPDNRVVSGLGESPEDRVVTDTEDLAVGWHHIAMVEDYDTDLRLYVDGFLVGTDNDDHLGKSVNIVGQDLYIGIFGPGGTAYSGIIDEVRIWNTARTHSEIRNSMFTQLEGDEPNLVSYYRFDQGIAGGDNTFPPVDILPDRSLNNHNGTLSNFALTGPTSNWVGSDRGQRPFVTTWKTDNPGVSGSTSIEIPGLGPGADFDIYWEEVGNPSNNGILKDQVGIASIDFGIAGIYRIEITGLLPQLRFNNGGDREKLLSVEQWGDIQWNSMEGAFYGCSNLTIPATDEPDLSNVTSMQNAFRRCTSMVGTTLDDWDVSNVQLMIYTFARATIFNGDIGGWNVGNVTDMSDMFLLCEVFNRDLNNWNVSNVTNMDSMLQACFAFNGDITTWDVSNVTNMYGMFVSDFAFNQDLSGWDVSNVTDMSYLFTQCTSFDQDIGSWNVSNVTSMVSMFSETPFNQDITGWNTSLVTDMSFMFYRATNFNQDISTWNTANVVNMNAMFWEEPVFNQDISSWNTANVTDMGRMFQDATSFNQSLGSWDISNVFTMANMLDNSGLSTQNYDATLIGWSNLPTAPGLVVLGAAGLTYCQGQSAWDYLFNTLDWDIVGDTFDCTGISLGDIEVNFNAEFTVIIIDSGQPEAIDLGVEYVGNDLTGNFAIFNGGTGDLEVSSINVDNNAFSVAASLSTISAGSSIAFDVTLSGQNEGVFATEVTIMSDDADENPFIFNVTGEILSQQVFIKAGSDNTGAAINQNEQINLGSTLINNDLDRFFVVENTSATDLTINSILSDNSQIQVLNPPASVLAGSFEPFTIRLLASQVGTQTARIDVSTDLGNVSFDITGEVLQILDLNIYNVVTPNGDNIHDFFKIGNIESYPENVVRIFDRWGRMVYEVNSYDNNNLKFTGISNLRNNESLLSGTYYYYISRGDGSEPIRGYLQLITEN